MTLTIELTPTEEAQLTAAARQAGLAPAALARKLVTEHLPPLTPDTPEDPALAPTFATWPLGVQGTLSREEIYDHLQ